MSLVSKQVIQVLVSTEDDPVHGIAERDPGGPEMNA